MNTDVVRKITETALAIMQIDAKVILFGSMARDDCKENSDWDILILLNKDKLEENDHTLYTYPFWELGWETGAMIHPIIYTRNEWDKKKGGEFFQNVEGEGLTIC